MKQYRCPKCGATKFSAAAHITQEWELDANGEFADVITDCMDVTHKPNDDDLWSCLVCGYEAPGNGFHVIK